MAQIDDVYLIGPRAWAVQAYETMRAAYAAIGLQLRDDKGFSYCPAGYPDDAREWDAQRGIWVDAAIRVPVSDAGAFVRARGDLDAADLVEGGADVGARGVTVVGAAVGETAFEEAAARRTCRSAALQFNRLFAAVTDRQTVALLARSCVLTRLTYLIRTVPPSSVRGPAAGFDAVSTALFQDNGVYGVVLADTGPLGPARLALARLPLRHGGAGWWSAAATLDAAYLASRLAAANGLCDVSDEWHQSGLDFAARLDGVAAPLPAPADCPHFDLRSDRELVAAHLRICALLPDERRQQAHYDESLVTNLATTEHLQRRLSHAAALVSRDAIAAAVLAERAAADASARRGRAAYDAACDRGAHEDDALFAWQESQARQREARRFQLVWEAARDHGWGVSDYLAVTPDSVDHRGFVSMMPEVCSVTMLIPLGLPHPQLSATELRCPCNTVGAGGSRGCRSLDPALDVAASCNRGGHVVSLKRRHDLWCLVWRAFCSALQMPAIPEDRGHIVRPDISVWADPTGSPVALDITIGHPTPPGAAAFGTLEARLRAQHAAKLRQYRDGGWFGGPDRPHLIPIVASTLGVVGSAGRRFFARVMRQRARSAPSAAVELSHQNLNHGQFAVLWRRRICTFLRIVVATAIVARVQHASGVTVASGLAFTDADVQRALSCQHDALRGVSSRRRAASDFDTLMREGLGEFVPSGSSFPSPRRADCCPSREG